MECIASGILLPGWDFVLHVFVWSKPQALDLLDVIDELGVIGVENLQPSLVGSVTIHSKGTQRKKRKNKNRGFSFVFFVSFSECQPVYSQETQVGKAVIYDSGTH